MVSKYSPTEFESLVVLLTAAVLFLARGDANGDSRSPAVAAFLAGSLRGFSSGLGRGGGDGTRSISSMSLRGVCSLRVRHAPKAGSCSSMLHRFGYSSSARSTSSGSC